MWIQLSRWGMFRLMMFNVDKSTWDLKWITVIRLCFFCTIERTHHSVLTMDLLLLVVEERFSLCSVSQRFMHRCYLTFLSHAHFIQNQKHRWAEFLILDLWSYRNWTVSPALKWIASIMHTSDNTAESLLILYHFMFEIEPKLQSISQREINRV